MINLNALLRRPVEYYEYPWAIEGRLRSAQSRFRSLFQPSDVGFIFAKSMPRSGHRFLTECLDPLFRAGAALLRVLPAGMLPPDSLRAGPATRRQDQPLLHAEEPRFRLSRFDGLNGKYLIQYRSPIPRLQSNYDLPCARDGRAEQGELRRLRRARDGLLHQFLPEMDRGRRGRTRSPSPMKI